MRCGTWLMVLAVVACWVVSGCESGSPSGVAGTWRGTTSGMGGNKDLTYDCRLVLAQDGNDLTGTYTIGLNKLSVTGTTDGSRVTLSGADSYTRRLDLTVQDDQMTGTETYSSEWSGFTATVSLRR